MAAPVPGFPHLRYIGGAAAKPAEQQDQPFFLAALNRVGAQLGVIIDIFSGSGSPSVRGGGFVGDPHDRNIAADATINGVPIGQYPGAVAAIHSQGLRSGATDFTYQGKTDPAHVDAVNLSTPTTTTSGSSITNLDQFFRAVLVKLGLPTTTANVQLLEAQAQAEGTSAKNNPLATTLGISGQSAALPGNSAGVQQYTTPEVGVNATARTLQSYPGILSLLRTGAPLTVGLTSSANADYTRWSNGNTGYGRQVFLNAQGNPKGTTADISLGSFDLGALLSEAGGAAKHIPGVQQAVDAYDATLSTGKFLGRLTQPSYILRGLQVAAGGVLILVGTVLLARQVGLAADLPNPVRAAPGVAAVAAVE